MSARAVITGAGAIVFAGTGREALGRAAGGPPPAPAEITGFECPQGAPTAACELTEFAVEDYLDSVQSYLDRASALAIAGTRLALEDAGLLAQETRSAPVGLAYATAWGCLDSMQVFYAEAAERPRRAPPLPFSHSYANSPSSMVAIEFALRGFALTLSSGTACGLAAVSAAARAVAEGSAQAVVAGASEALSEPLYRHMLKAGVLSQKGLIEPDEGDGTVPGEGAAFVVLENEAAARARGARVLGGELSCGSAGRAAVADSVAAAAAAAGAAPVVYRSASGVRDFDRAEREGLARASLQGARCVAIKQYTGEAHSASPVAALVTALARGEEALVVAADPGGSAEAVRVRGGAQGG